MNITIPKTIAQAQKALNGVGQLLTAKEWERAAIVYAFTQKNLAGESLSPEAFAKLGITGLRGGNAVRAYRKAWQDAIEDGMAEAVSPGDTAVLPTRAFPSTKTGAPESGPTAVTAAIKRNPAVLAEVIREGGHEMATAVAEGLASDPMVASGINYRLDQIEQERNTHTPTTKEPMPAKVAENLIGDVARFWDGMVTGSVPPSSREAVAQMIAANRNSPSLSGIGGLHGNPLPNQLADVLREMAATATKYADLIEDTATIEVTA